MESVKLTFAFLAILTAQLSLSTPRRGGNAHPVDIDRILHVPPLPGGCRHDGYFVDDLTGICVGHIVGCDPEAGGQIVSEKVTFTVGDLGPFDGTLGGTLSQGLYELHFGRIQGDQTIFRDGRRIQIFRDGEFDIIGQAQRIQFELTTTERCITSGKIEVLAT